MFFTYNLKPVSLNPWSSSEQLNLAFPHLDNLGIWYRCCRLFTKHQILLRDGNHVDLFHQDGRNRLDNILERLLLCIRKRNRTQRLGVLDSCRLVPFKSNRLLGEALVKRVGVVETRVDPLILKRELYMMRKNN